MERGFVNATPATNVTITTPKTTTVDLVIRLQIEGSSTDVACYRTALENLAQVMCVHTEDGLWSAGYADGGSDEAPNEFVTDIESCVVHAVRIDGEEAP